MTLKPLQRQALLTLLASATQILKRRRGGYQVDGAGDVFTVRTVNGLHDAGLVTFHPPQFPTEVRLSADGRAIAEQLQASESAKAVAS